MRRRRRSTHSDIFGGPGEIWGPHLSRKEPPWLTHQFAQIYPRIARLPSARRSSR
nr:MAG TPA: hypothetical protein [Caudoviricetes sp.]